MTAKKVLSYAGTSALAVLSAFLFLSCGGSGNNDSGSGSPGTVGLYLTDDMSLFSRVTATIDSVQILNTGSGAACDVLTTPLAVNMSGLANVMHLVSIAACPNASYNRIRIGFEKTVVLATAPTGTDPGATSLCSFVSYKDGGNKPNTLSCKGTGCSLDITGAVNVLAGTQNKLALDFNLKEFDVVGFGTPTACSVTMKVSPLHAGEMEALAEPEGVTGLISGLSTTDRTFTLTRGSSTFTVIYTGITSTQQPGLDTLLRRAEIDGLRVKVLSPGMDLSTNIITATAVYVKIEGTVSGLDTAAHTFTLSYKGAKTLPVDYTHANAAGALSNGAEAVITLYGFDGAEYLALTVDAGDAGIATDN